MTVMFCVSADYFENARGTECGLKAKIDLNFLGMRNHSQGLQNKIVSKISRSIEKTFVNALGLSVSSEVEPPKGESRKINFVSGTMESTIQARGLIAKIREGIKSNGFSDKLLELINKTISIDELIRLSFVYKKARGCQEEAAAFGKMSKQSFYYNGLHPKPDGANC